MSWGRRFGSARFDHFSKDRVERLGLLEVDVVPSSGNNAARNCALGICAKVGKDLAVLRIKPPRQIANWDTAPRKLAKRANRLAPQRHLVGTRLLERERERFRVVGKTARPKSFPLVIVQVALTFEQGQARPPVHESGHPFVSHARRPREVTLAQCFTRGVVGRPKPRAFKHEGGEGNSSGHPHRIASRSRCRIPLTDPSHVQAISSIAWSEGCGASERSAVEIAAIPQVIRSKARRLKRHAPAHGVPNQNGRHTCVARNNPTKSKERSRLEAQVEEVRALRGVAASGTGARPMPRKLETETLSTRTCKQPHRIIPGGSLLREAVDKHDRDRWGVTFPRIRRRSTPRLHAKAHALEIEAARLPPNLARHFAALLQNLACHLRRPSFAPMRCIRSNAPHL